MMSTVGVSGCVSVNIDGGNGDNEPASTETDANSRSTAEQESDNSDSTPTMTADVPTTLTGDTHPINLDPVPPEGWKWEGTFPIDDSDFEKGISARYAESLDAEYDLRIRRYDSPATAKSELEDAKRVIVGLEGVSVGVTRGRFFFETRGGTSDGGKQLLAQIEGLNMDYVSKNSSTWEI